MGGKSTPFGYPLRLRQYSCKEASYLGTETDTASPTTNWGGFFVDKCGQPYLGDPKIRTTFFVDGCPHLSRVSVAAGMPIPQDFEVLSLYLIYLQMAVWTQMNADKFIPLLLQKKYLEGHILAIFNLR